MVTILKNFTLFPDLETLSTFSVQNMFPGPGKDPPKFKNYSRLSKPIKPRSFQECFESAIYNKAKEVSFSAQICPQTNLGTF